MNNVYSFAPVDAAKPEDTAGVTTALKLLVSLGDVKGTTAMLEKLQAATEAHRAAIKESDAKLAEVERREASLQKRLDDEASDMARARAEHDRRLSDERRSHEAQLAARVKELEQREAAAAAAHARAVELHSDYERRLALVKEAAR